MISLAKWAPKSLQALRGYTLVDLAHDAVAGLTVGMVALPLAMAFGIASGVSPQTGIYTAIVAGFLISALGGSRTQIGGPTGAFVVVVAAIIAKHGLSGLLTVTVMAGVMLVLLGVTGLGSAVRFIPRPVVVGFTNGIAVLIASTQIKDFLGIATPQSPPSEFLQRMQYLAHNLGLADAVTVLVALASLAVILLAPRLWRRLPGSIVALVLATLSVWLFDLPVATIGSKFGGIPSTLPAFAVPDLRFDLMLPLLPSAVTVAVLCAIESLLSAVVADTMTGDRHDSNVELVAQGVANIAVPFLGGIPVTGAIARTATNIRSGARSPVAGMVHALVLLVTVLVGAPLARYIPLATLAAVLFVVAYNMGEWREIPLVLRLEVKDIAVWLLTFVLTIVADLTVAVEVGMVLASLLYIYRVAQTTVVDELTADTLERSRTHLVHEQEIPDYVTIFHVQGPLLFGAADKLSDLVLDEGAGDIVLLRVRYMTAIDATGIHAIERFRERVHAEGRTLLLCGLRGQPRKLVRSSHLYRVMGPRNVLPNIGAALRRAAALHKGADE